MNEVERGSAPAMPFQEPANSLVDGIWDFLEPLLGNGEFITERDYGVVDKHTEHTAPMLNAVEFDQLENLPAGFAMKSQAQQRLPDLHDSSRRQIVEVIAIDHDVFTQIAGLKAEFGGGRARHNQRLAERCARHAAGNAVRAACDRRHRSQRCIVLALYEKFGDLQTLRSLMRRVACIGPAAEYCLKRGDYG